MLHLCACGHVTSARFLPSPHQPQSVGAGTVHCCHPRTLHRAWHLSGLHTHIPNDYILQHPALLSAPSKAVGRLLPLLGSCLVCVCVCVCTCMCLCVSFRLGLLEDKRHFIHWGPQPLSGVNHVCGMKAPIVIFFSLPSTRHDPFHSLEPGLRGHRLCPLCH